MARYEGEIVAAGEAEVELGEWVQAVVGPDSRPSRDRCQTLAQLLSGSEGWKAASTALRGAFAENGIQAGLTGPKER